MTQPDSTPAGYAPALLLNVAARRLANVITNAAKSNPETRAVGFYRLPERFAIKLGYDRQEYDLVVPANCEVKYVACSQGHNPELWEVTWCMHPGSVEYTLRRTGGRFWVRTTDVTHV